MEYQQNTRRIVKRQKCFSPQEFLLCKYMHIHGTILYDAFQIILKKLRVNIDVLFAVYKTAIDICSFQIIPYLEQNTSKVYRLELCQYRQSSK